MIKCFFDGCCEPINPGGVASYGVIILKENKKIFKASKLFESSSVTSNNVAEYAGFKEILDYLIKNSLQNEEIIIYGDSNLVIQQMFGTWKIKKGFYVPIAKYCKNILSKFTNLKGQWIPREENFLADELSKAELLKAGIKFKIQPQDAVLTDFSVHRSLNERIKDEISRDDLRDNSFKEGDLKGKTVER